MRHGRDHLYQPPLWRFVGPGASPRRTGPATTFFLSFEDGLWTLCRYLDLREGRTFLVPDLYCMEVVEALRQRGYEVEHYRLDDELRADRADLATRIAAHPSAVVLVYHPLGMLSDLCRTTGWEATLGPDGVIVEDCAHRLLLTPSECRVHDRRFVLDSLRKVCPLQGSRLLSTPRHAAGLRHLASRRTAAGVKTIAGYRLWRATLLMSALSGAEPLWQASERRFEAHNDRVGTLDPPQRGPLLDRAAIRLLAPRTVARRKAALGRVYRRATRQLAERQGIVRSIAVRDRDLGRLKAYPVAVIRDRVPALLAWLEARRIHLDPVFPDSPHSRTELLLPLPMGPHMDPPDAARIVDALRQACDVDRAGSTVRRRVG